MKSTKGEVTFRVLVKGSPDVPADVESVTLTTNPANRDDVRRIFQTTCEILFNRTMNSLDHKEWRSSHSSFCELEPNHIGDCMNFDPASRIDEHAAMWIEHEKKHEGEEDDDG